MVHKHRLVAILVLVCARAGAADSPDCETAADGSCVAPGAEKELSAMVQRRMIQKQTLKSESIEQGYGFERDQTSEVQDGTSSDPEEEEEEDDTFNVTCTCVRLPGDEKEDGLSFGTCVTELGSSYYLFDDIGPVDDILPGSTVELELEEVSGEEFNFDGAPWVQQSEKVYRVIAFKPLDVDGELLQVLGVSGGQAAELVQENRYKNVGWASRCPSGTMSIQTASECRAAAGSLGLAFGWEGSWRKAGPACQVGCKDKVYYNTDKHSPGAKLICKTGIPCSPNAPAECASCTAPSGGVCEQCNDGTTLQANGACQATCADFRCPRGFASNSGAAPLTNPDRAKCCVDRTNGIVQAPWGAVACPSGTAPLDEAACKTHARVGSLAMETRGGDPIAYPARFKVSQPRWHVYKLCPPGCVYKTVQNGIYWNTRPDIPSGFRGCSLICRAPSQAPTPAPTTPAPTLAPTPAPTTNVAVPATWRRLILDKHNSLRAQESSSGMPKLAWDAALEASAQLWAEKCTFSHASKDAGAHGDCAGNACGQRNGENLWMSSGGSLEVQEAVQDWYDEKKDYSYADGTYQSSNCAAGKVCGHYTQVVSARTSKLGCAVVTGCTGTYANYIVCQYDPPGNMIGAPLFRTGTACGCCPIGYNFCQAGLCVGATPAALTGPFSWDQHCAGSPKGYTLNTCEPSAHPPSYQIVTMSAEERKWVARVTLYDDSSCTGQARHLRAQEVDTCDSKIGYPNKFTYDGTDAKRVAPGARTSGSCAADATTAPASPPATPATPAPTPVPTTPAATTAGWELIARQDIAKKLFSRNARDTFLENENDPRNDAFMSVGALDQSSADLQPDQDGKYHFKLVWDGDVELEWKQSNWLTDQRIAGSEGISPDNIFSGGRGWRFQGLAKSNSRQAVLDGNGYHGQWWNCVGAVDKHRGRIPGWNRKISKTFELYIYRGNPAPLPPTTPPPTADPTAGWELIAQQNVARKVFDRNTRNTYSENADDPHNDAFMKIGEMDRANPDLQPYQDGLYYFKLIWDGDVELEWKQSNWLTDQRIAGSEGISPDNIFSGGRGWRFQGLAKSSNRNAIFDGDGYGHGWWFNCVGAVGKFRGGMPGWNRKISKTMKLYIFKSNALG